jgi:multimeric flavodoxin WrbA
VRTLIINGSPRRKGDTSTLVTELKKHLQGDLIEVSAYYDKISPCIDCRACWKQKGCAIKDGMTKIYNDDYDNIVIASPVHMSNLTSPLLGIASRLQAYYAAKYIQHDKIILRRKRAVLIIVGGGDSGVERAIDQAKMMFRQLNAELDDQNMVFSLHTNHLPAGEDSEALKKIREIASRINEAGSGK